MAKNNNIDNNQQQHEPEVLMYFGTPNADGGWQYCNVINNEGIQKIEYDANINIEAEKEIVSIPSPFARFDLVKKAFGNVATLGDRAEQDDKRLVSNSLDLLQLFYEKSDNNITIECWNKDAQLDGLQRSKNGGTKIYADTLKLYMRQERMGFSQVDNIYIILHNTNPIGCTSPTSIFLPAPNITQIDDIRIDGACRLFGDIRMLKDRDPEFIKYVYAQRKIIQNHLGAEGYASLDSFFEYLDKQLEQMNNNTQRALYTLLHDPNFNVTENDNDRTAQIGQNGPKYDKSNYTLLGVPLYKRSEHAVAEAISSTSFFRLCSGKKPNAKPLILTNDEHYNGRPYTSTAPGGLYDYQKHLIEYDQLVYGRTRTTLPGTAIQYADGWLCDADFLSDVLLKVPYDPDDTHFFFPTVGSYEEKRGDKIVTQRYGYLLPIRDKYFEYFDIETLYDSASRKDRNGNTPHIRIVEEKDSTTGKEIKSVTVYLDIPVGEGNNMVTLKREYTPSADGDKNIILGQCGCREKHQASGYIVELSAAVNMFPFFKLKENNFYNIQIAIDGTKWPSTQCDIDLNYIGSSDLLESAKAKLNDRFNPSKLNSLTIAEAKQLAIEAGENIDTNKEPIWKLHKRQQYSKYYRAEYCIIQALTLSIATGAAKHEALLIPKWEMANPTETNALRFAFDFGTTNSYVAYSVNNSKDKRALSVSRSVVSTYSWNKSLYDDDTIRGLTLQEFLPRAIGGGSEYSFPMRTVVLHNRGLHIQQALTAMLETNIPFLYEKGDCGDDNEAKTDLKWGTDDKVQKLAESYIEELVLLARACALENNAVLKDVKFVWTFPLSMGYDVEKYNRYWTKYYKKYFKGVSVNTNIANIEEDENVTHLSESIAPLLYYKDLEGANRSLGNDGLTIDIGGETTDIVVKNSRSAIKFLSFRFASNAIFDACTPDTNPMIQAAKEKFCELFDSVQEQKSNREKFERFLSRTGTAKDANSFLFSLEHHELFSHINDIDAKSYNKFLADNKVFKIIFFYFYAAIVYYITKLLLSLSDEGYGRPRQIMFSGNGSKILSILGDDGFVKTYTKLLIEKFSGGKFSYTDGPNTLVILRERIKPKQITAEGALHTANDGDNNDEAIIYRDNEVLQQATIHYSIIKGLRELTIGDLCKEEIKKEVCASVEDFHKLFFELVEESERIANECDPTNLKKIIENEDLMIHMTEAINDDNGNVVIDDNNRNRIFTGSLFFYPIKSLLKHRIIPNIIKSN